MLAPEMDLAAMGDRKPINASTRICAVYGHPVKHSASPAMHNAAMETLGLDWRYLAFDVHPDHLRQAIAGAKAMNFVGLNLTVPHKLMAMDIVEVVDPAARRWGAINTVRFEGLTKDNQWRGLGEIAPDEAREVRTVGFNTDADAIIQAIREDLGLAIKGAKVLIVGAGGAGRAAALRIALERPAELWLANRTSAKAEELAREILAEQSDLQVHVGFPEHRIDLLLNATSLGLRPEDPSPLAGANFELPMAANVYDMIYKPAQTKLLRAANDAQCRTANGLGMLLHQGAKALEIWSGRPAPIEVMREALRRHIYG